MSVYHPIDDDPAGGGGGGGYADPSYRGGSSTIRYVDATHFDIMSPNLLLLSGIQAGGSYSGTASSANSGASSTYRWAFGAFGGEQGYPAAVAYHQQRRVFACTYGNPQTVWMSRIAAFIDFGKSSPIQDDDAVIFTLNAGQLNAIRGMLSLRRLLLLTTDMEWTVSGSGNGGAVTPSDIQVDPQGYRGASKLPVLGVGNVALYVQSKGQIIRDVGYDFAEDSYKGNDLTVMASHLVQGKKIVDWAWQQAPFSCLWMVRNDGVLLGATYMREQQVIGWHRHDTDGTFESVCVIPEGDEDVLYACVVRTIGGVQKRFIERMHTRYFTDRREAFFVDSGLTFDGRSGYRGTATDHSATTMTVTGGTNWDYTEELTITSSASFFVGATDVGDQVVFEDADGFVYRLTITSYTSGTVVKARPNRTLPAAYRGAARTDWYIARDSISGLDHLEGKTVAVFADGDVQSEKVVASGKVTLDSPAFIASIGLPFTSDIETLEVIEQSQGVTIGKNKQIPTASIMVEEAATFHVGRDFDHLEAQVAAPPALYDQPYESQSGVLRTSFPTRWGIDGSVCIRNTDPTPITILGIIPNVNVGG